MWQLMHAVLGLSANLCVCGSFWIYCSHHSSSFIFFKFGLSTHAAPWLTLKLEVVRDRHGLWFVFTISTCLNHPYRIQFVFALQLISNHQSGWSVVTLGSELDAEAMGSKDCSISSHDCIRSAPVNKSFSLSWWTFLSVNTLTGTPWKGVYLKSNGDHWKVLSWRLWSEGFFPPIFSAEWRIA